MFAMLLHIYNDHSWEKIFAEKLRGLQQYSPILMINLCLTHPQNDQLISTIKKDFPEAFVIRTPNKGRDIGGKLALIDLYIKTKQKADYIVFLHDKTSSYLGIGEQWRTELFRIIEPNKVSAIIDQFAMAANTGIIGVNDFIRNEFSKKANKFESPNSEKLSELIAKYHLRITDYRFVAGTMFWIRSSIIQKFFSKHSPLACREILEEGNFTDRYRGTFTHSWERIFCWLANDQGYVIKGI
jgi:lipopolysaccharide biosynthesis protein